MSQNFELLKQIEYERELSNATPPRRRVENVAHAAQLDFSNELMDLAQSLFLSNNSDGPHEVLFCGIDREGGSSHICLELGRLLAAFSSHSVCLVDGDVHDLRLWQLVNVPQTHSQNDPWCEGCIQIEPNLWIANAESMDPSSRGALAEAYALKKRLGELKGAFSFVLINAPGINVRNDAGVLGQIADGVILVIEANSTRKAAALKAKKTLEAMNVRLLGTILNNRTFPIPQGLYSKL